MEGIKGDMIEKCYFVDTENVGKSFLPCLEILDETNQVYIFLGAKIYFNATDMNILLRSRANIEVIQCQVGTPNALDFQLSSYLGRSSLYFGRCTKYFVISKDNGYRPLIWFWEKQGIEVLCRQKMTQIPSWYHLSEGLYYDYLDFLSDEEYFTCLNQLNEISGYLERQSPFENLNFDSLTLLERAIVLSKIERYSNLSLRQLKEDGELNKGVYDDVDNGDKSYNYEPFNGLKEVLSGVEKVLYSEDASDNIEDSEINVEELSENEGIKDSENNPDINVEEQDFVVQDAPLDSNELLTETNNESEISDIGDKEENTKEKDENKSYFTMFVGNIKANKLAKKIKDSDLISDEDNNFILDNRSLLSAVHKVDTETAYVLAYTLYYANNIKLIEKYIERFLDKESIEKILITDFDKSYYNINNWNFLK